MFTNTLGLYFGRFCRNADMNITHTYIEHFCDAVSRLCWCLEVVKAVTIGPKSSFRIINNPLSFVNLTEGVNPSVNPPTVIHNPLPFVYLKELIRDQDYPHHILTTLFPVFQHFLKLGQLFNSHKSSLFSHIHVIHCITRDVTEEIL